MPIYMDIHNIPGIEAPNLAEAHQKDLLVQDKYQCKCMTYWMDQTRGNVFCLIEAPNQSVMEEMHRKSHGFVPHKIIEVNNDVVEAFLGRTQDPADAKVSDKGLKIFSDSAFRVILVTENTDAVVLQNALGLQKANDLLKKIAAVIRKEITLHSGREVEHAGTGFLVSFSTVANATDCALEIQKNLSNPDKKLTGFKMGIDAGDPVAKSDKVFGDTIRLARLLCTVGHNRDKVMVSSMVKKMIANAKNQKHLMTLSPQDEIFLESLFTKLEKNWQDPDFAMALFCQSMSMSKSQLYRKTTALWGLSPNQLLKEYRLDKARDLLKGKKTNISQTVFDSGFNSPSYFTKCFKKKFGLLPATYQGSL